MRTATELPPGFVETRRAALPQLAATVHEASHEASGARFLHIACPFRDTFFDAVYRTIPPDSSGLPHITEHTVSGGSRKFPAGAGAAMYRRSLVTDLNGMTSADHTQYYFASPIERDVRNWIAYMVDGTLFTLRGRDTFLRQRGHLEHAVADDPGSGLRYTGVIYNEMKAVFAVPLRHAYIALDAALFPGHPYSRDSGGIPRHIPNLTYEEYIGFCERHYHPGNAWYVSWGPAPFDLILQEVEKNGLGEFPRLPPVQVPPISRPAAPVSLEAPLPGGEPFALVGWAGTDGASPAARLRLRLVAEALFSPGSPVLNALEREHAIPAAAVKAQRHELLRPLHVLQLPGVDAGRAAAAERTVLLALERVAERGVPAELVQRALSRWELQRREAANATEVFLDSMMPELCYEGDPVAALDMESLLEAVRGDVADGMRETVRRELLENPHRALAAMTPDPELRLREEQLEAETVERLAAELSEEERASLVEDAKRISTPKVVDAAPVPLLDPRTADVPAFETGHRSLRAADVEVQLFEAPTGGLVYGFAASALAPDEDTWLLATLLRARAAGELEIRPVFATSAGGDGALGWLEVSGRAPAERAEDLAGRLAAVLQPAEFTAVEVRAAAAARLAELEGRLMAEAQPHLLRRGGARLRRHLEWEDETLGLGALRQARSFEPRSIRFVPRAAGSATASDAPGEAQARHEAWTTEIPVAFNGVVWRIPPIGHPDAAPAAVLAQQMRYGHLTREVGRKGQAYGVDVEADHEHGVLWASSRRDPNLESTHRAFADALAIAAEGGVTDQEVEDSILSAYRPTMAAATADVAGRRAFRGGLTGRTPEAWSDYHRRLRAVTTADLQRVAAGLGEAVRTTLTSPEGARAAAALFDAIESA